MKKIPNDDERLVNFLRQNRPEVPPAAPDLEEKILQAVESSANSDPNLLSKNSMRSRQLWLVPSAIAATVVLALSSDTLRSNSLSNPYIFEAANSQSPVDSLITDKFNFSPQNTHVFGFSLSGRKVNKYTGVSTNRDRAELAKLEKLLENNWHSTVTSNHPEMEPAIEAKYLSLSDAKPPQSLKSTTLSTTRR